MRISLDYGSTWIEAPQGVKVDYPLDQEEFGASLIATFSSEGLIVDQCADGEVGECEETVCVPIDNLVEFLFAGAAK